MSVIKKHKLLIERIMLSILRDIFSDDVNKMKKTILNAARYLVELEDKQTALHYFETYMRYIFSSYQEMTERDFREITKDIEKIFIEGSEYAMTLAEIFRREGRQEGKQ